MIDEEAMFANLGTRIVLWILCPPMMGLAAAEMSDEFHAPLNSMAVLLIIPVLIWAWVWLAQRRHWSFKPLVVLGLATLTARYSSYARNPPIVVAVFVAVLLGSTVVFHLDMVKRRHGHDPDQLQ